MLLAIVKVNKISYAALQTFIFAPYFKSCKYCAPKLNTENRF